MHRDIEGVPEHRGAVDASSKCISERHVKASTVLVFWCLISRLQGFDSGHVYSATSWYKLRQRGTLGHCGFRYLPMITIRNASLAR